MTTPKKPKSSLLHRLKSGIKSLLGSKKKKPEAKAHEGHEAHPEKLHPAAKHPTKKHATEHPQGERKPARPPRPEGERREGPRAPREGDRGPRAARDGERGPRGGRDARGSRDGRSGPGGRGGRSGKPVRGEGEERAPRQNFEALPPPPAPPVPEGPYPEAFQNLGFSDAVLAAIREFGYTTPTEIQEKAAPIVLSGKDLVGASQTGTGKTAAFGMPAITRLGAPGNLRCLILEPTRELAAQVVEHFERLGKHTGLRTLLVHGGVGYEKQRKGLQQGVDIVVATPGRLLDFMQDGTVNLDTIEILILDEVDRMLDMGFLPDVRRIVERTPRTRQTLFFSATMPAQIKGLADWALKEPASVEVGIRFSPSETVSHYLYPVASDQREELLLELLRRTDFHSVMIFTRTKMDADRLYGSIQRDGEHKVAVMHGDITQRDREKALQDFRDGTVEVIVATDVAARGLDISGVTHVVNYMVPEHSEDYVHRIGRTGRAKKEGDAFTLFTAEEIGYVASIERLIGQEIERKKLDNFPYKYTTVLANEDKARAIMFGRKGKKRR
ncbi:MAG TPA: DEAD/DEAH box helicase [Candidatus Saccharimonadia bacterium]|nr:DEAD/DEAH box helicase [Candidatus Saccharimonadia bacterium]